MYSNCLVWAVCRYAQLQKEWLKAGQPPLQEPEWYVRSSRMAPWWVPSWGVQYRRNGRFIQEKFSPADKTKLKWYQAWRKFWFKGYVEIVDATNQ